MTRKPMYAISVCYFPVFFQLSKHASMQPRLCRGKILLVTVYTPCRSNFRPYFDPDFSVHSFQRLARHLNFLTVSVVPCERNTRVYMIAPVKKFGRVRLSTNFSWKQIWRRMQTWKGDEFLLGFKFSRGQISRKVSMNFFNGPSLAFLEPGIWDFKEIWKGDSGLYLWIGRGI